MKHEMEPEAHPTDEALAGWVDARIGRDGDPSQSAPVTAHLADCAACRARVAALQEVVAALREEPPAPDAAALATSRTRILEAVAASGPSLARRPSRAWWWIPFAAAAGLAALLVLRPFDDGESPVVMADRPVAERAPEGVPPALPVVTAGEEAADLVVGEIEVEPASESVVLDPSTAPMPGATLADVALADEFASLSAEDQDAILEELAVVELEM